MKWIWTAILLICGLVMAQEDRNIDFAPFFQVENNLEHSRVRILGPIFERREDAQGRKTYAVRPLFSRYEDLSREFIAQDILYPVLSYRLNGIKLQQRGVVGISIDDNIHDPNSSWQDYILPLYFNGRGKDGKRYFALFPIGGNIRYVFSYKLIRFYLFPLYMKTIKSNDIVNYHVLWPIFHKADGENIKKRKVFPLIGYTERFGQWRQNFLLWPLFNWGYSLDPKAPGKAFGLFPLFAKMWLRQPEKGKWFNSYSALFPFFAYAESESSFYLQAPWPFFQYGKRHWGPNSYRLWLWPFYGKTIKRGSTETFWMWPLYFNYHRPIPDGLRKMQYFFIFWLHAVDENYEENTRATFTRVWPIGSMLVKEKELDDGSVQKERHIKILDIFPMRNVHAVDRNMAPIWTIYQYHKGPNGCFHELLWGLVQCRTAKDGALRELSIFPFFNYELTDQEVKKFRVLLGLYARKDFKDGTKKRRYGWLFSHTYKDGKALGHGILPFYDYEKSAEDEFRKFSLLLGLYSRKKNEKAVVSSRYGWLVSHKKRGGQTLGHGVFPFYNKDETADGTEKRFNILGGLWGYRRRPDGSSYNRLFWFFRINHKGPDLVSPGKEDLEPAEEEKTGEAANTTKEPVTDESIENEQEEEKEGKNDDTTDTGNPDNTDPERVLDPGSND